MTETVLPRANVGSRYTIRRPAAWAALAAVLCIGAGFHFYGLGSKPAGLYNDETALGMFALKTLAGGYWPVFISEDFQGRGVLYHYLAAASIWALGRTPGALRLPSELAAVGTILGVYLFSAAVTDRRRALLASLICATTIWPMLIARFATGRSLLAMLTAFSLWLGVLGWRTGRWGYWAGAGVLLAAAFYTTPAIRISVVAFAVGAVYLAVRSGWRRVWRGGLATGLAFGVVILPLAIYFVLNPAGPMRRVEATLLFSLSMPPGEALALLVSQTSKVLRMFTFAGDWNPLNNTWLPGTLAEPRPVFDAWLAIPFYLGHLVWLWRWRSARTHLVYLWAAVGLLPTLLTDEAPHYGRALLILPVLFLWPAEGLVTLADWLSRRVSAVAGLAVPGLLLMHSIWGTFNAIILADRYGQRWVTAEYEDGREAELAIEANRFLSQGWVGDNLVGWPMPGQADRRVVIDSKLWRPLGDRSLLELLINSHQPGVQIVAADDPAVSAALETLLFLPADHARNPLDFFGSGLVVNSHPGGWSWNIEGDTRLDALYWAYTATQPDFDPAGQPAACWLDGRLCLMAYEMVYDENGAQVHLVWRGQPAAEEFQLFVQLRQMTNVPAANATELAAGLPFAQWRSDIYVATSLAWPVAAQDGEIIPPVELTIFPSATAETPVAPDGSAEPLILIND